MKSYTDIEQSKKLSEILLSESADMFYHYNIGIESYYDNVPRVIQVGNHFEHFIKDIPCWSLAALLMVMPLGCNIYRTKKGVTMIYYCKKEIIILSDNFIDACMEMIFRLHELNKI